MGIPERTWGRWPAKARAGYPLKGPWPAPARDAHRDAVCQIACQSKPTQTRQTDRVDRVAATASTLALRGIFIR